MSFRELRGEYYKILQDRHDAIMALIKKAVAENVHVDIMVTDIREARMAGESLGKSPLIHILVDTGQDVAPEHLRINYDEICL